jgi:hypothetical protein
MTRDWGRGPWPWRSAHLSALWCAWRWLLSGHPIVRVSLALGFLALLFAAGYWFGRSVVHWPPVWRVTATWPAV